MKVKARVWLLMAFCGMLALTGLYFVHQSQGKRIGDFRRELVQREKLHFEALVSVIAEPAERFVSEATANPEIASLVNRGTAQGGVGRIRQKLTEHKTNAVWIFDASFQQTVAVTDQVNPAALPVTAPSLRQIFANGRFCHFFAAGPQGIMEVFGATLHAADDPERKYAPRGYILAGKIWDDARLFELASLSNSDVKIVPVQEAEFGRNKLKAHNAIAFTYPLPSREDKPFARFDVINRSPVISNLQSNAFRQLMLLLAVEVLILAAVYFLLMSLIAKPVSILAHSLESDEASVLLPFEGDKSEFGSLAQLIKTVIEQKEELTAHTDAENKLKKELEIADDEMEARVKERTADLLKANDALRKEIEALKASAAEDQLKRSQEILTLFRSNHKLRKEKANVNLIVERVIPLIAEQIAVSNVKVLKEFTEGMPDVVMDAAQVQQALVNLCINAIEAMPQGGTLMIKTRLVEKDGRKYAEVLVQDNGIGISDDHKENIFKPFFTTKTDTKGSGFGLVIVKEVVDRHAGVIDFFSAVGKGTVFALRLPL